MTSRTTRRFRTAFDALPSDVQTKAKEAFELWKRDPRHTSLRFKKVHPTLPIYSVRVGLHWRSLAIIKDDTAVWFWIGSHAEYDSIITGL